MIKLAVEMNKEFFVKSLWWIKDEVMKLEEVCYTNVQALYLQKQMKAREKEKRMEIERTESEVAQRT